MLRSQKPKTRADIPDAFVLQALLELSSSVGVVHFIVEDKPFREALGTCSQIICHSNIYNFCSSQRLAFDVSREKELQKRVLPMPRLENAASKMLRDKLPGLTLRLPPEAAVEVDKLAIELVREVQSCTLEPNSVIHLAADDYLVEFTATVVAQCEVPPEYRLMETAGASPAGINYVTELHGHILVTVRPGATVEELSCDIDAFSVARAELAEAQDVVRVTRAPEFITDRWFIRYVDEITAPGRTGLVIVAGSKELYRRQMAEPVLRTKQRRDSDLGALYLMNYPPEFSKTLLFVKSSWGSSAENDLFEKAVATSAKAIALSVEDQLWLPATLNFVAQYGGFVVATIKRLTSVSAVVRELYRQGKDIALEHLIGVMIVMAGSEKRINFRATTHGEWGDGSWWDILEHDKLVRPSVD